MTTDDPRSEAPEDVAVREAWYALATAQVEHQQHRGAAEVDRLTAAMAALESAIAARTTARLARVQATLTMPAHREAHLRAQWGAMADGPDRATALLAELDAWRATAGALRERGTTLEAEVTRLNEACDLCEHPVSDHYDADACLIEGCKCVRMRTHPNIEKLHEQTKAERDAATLALEGLREAVGTFLRDFRDDEAEKLRAALRSALSAPPATPPAPPWDMHDACKVCEALPDETGTRHHGKGCYMVSEDGGGEDSARLASAPAADMTGEGPQHAYRCARCRSPFATESAARDHLAACRVVPTPAQPFRPVSPASGVAGVVADIVTWLREREEAYDESRHRASMRGADVYTIDTLDARAKTYQYAADEIEKRWSGGGECR